MRGNALSNDIDYFLSVISPWSYLGHPTLVEIAARHGCGINFRPVALPAVWQNSGSVPLGQRSAVRQRYRFVELQRYAELRGMKLNYRPAHFPANPEPAELAITAISLGGGDAAAFALACGEAVWSREMNIADESVIARLLAETGHDPSAVLEASRTPATAAGRAANNAAAIAADAIGVPTYVHRGETFWGQDRLDMLERMIASGRPAYQTL